MVVVADTSPINYLVLIEQIDLLIAAVHANSDSTLPFWQSSSIRSHRNRYATGPAIRRNGWKFLVRKTV